MWKKTHRRGGSKGAGDPPDRRKPPAPRRRDGAPQAAGQQARTAAGGSRGAAAVPSGHHQAPPPRGRRTPAGRRCGATRSYAASCRVCIWRPIPSKPGACGGLRQQLAASSPVPAARNPCSCAPFSPGGKGRGDWGEPRAAARWWLPSPGLWRLRHRPGASEPYQNAFAGCSATWAAAPPSAKPLAGRRMARKLRQRCQGYTHTTQAARRRRGAATGRGRPPQGPCPGRPQRRRASLGALGLVVPILDIGTL